MVLGLALVGVAGLIAWGLLGGDGDEAPSGQPGAGAAGFRAFEGDEGGEPSEPEQVTDRQDAGSEVVAQEEFQGTIVRPDIGSHASRDDAERDAGDAGPLDVRVWKDPVNQQVLGQKQWMAELPDAETQAIEEALDEKPPQRYPYDLAVRRSGIDITKQIVAGCFARLEEKHPQASGRLAVGYNLAADGRQGRFRDVEILVKVRLDYPSLDQCILDRLSKARFPTTEEGVMWVEYPFVFEDNLQMGLPR